MQEGLGLLSLFITVKDFKMIVISTKVSIFQLPMSHILSPILLQQVLYTATTTKTLFHIIRRHHVYEAIWDVFVGEIFVCEQETQIKATAFITITATCTAATNQGQLLLRCGV